MLYLSRKRELMADAGCVELLRTNEPLARALIKIDEDHKTNTETYNHAYGATPHEQVRQTAYLYDPSDAGMPAFKSLNDMFSTHPSLAERLQSLGIEKRL
jgi:heat shock protein HtpX